MFRRLRKSAAIIMAASLFFQSQGTVFAEEPQTEYSVEALAEEGAQTELSQTEAPQTEAPKPEAPQTEAPEAETVQTEAPKPETPQTEAPKPETPQTEAPQTEAPQTEKKDGKQTEKEKNTEKSTENVQETETEKETELSRRKNDGKKMTSLDLVTGLQSALPYLFAAGTIDAPEGLLEHQNIAEAGEGTSVLNSLAGFSLELADGVSAADVEIINLYADDQGKLDAAQLDQKFPNRVIDVTQQYYVVNVIAASENQNLTFSGYDMLLSGSRVSYEEGQPGDIIYNFAALKGEGYTDYKGTLTLSKADGLQGTFLAPKAKAVINSDLAGAVFADQITVTDSQAELLQIVFKQGMQLPDMGDAVPFDLDLSEEGETESESGTSKETETESESETSKETETESESETSKETETESESETSKETETESESETAAETEIPVDPAKEAVIRLQAVKADKTSDPERQLQNAVFVVRDEKGKYLKDSAGKVKQFNYNGKAVSIGGLTVGMAYTLVQLSTDEGYILQGEETVLADRNELDIEIQNQPVPADSRKITVTAVPSFGEVTLKALSKQKTGIYLAAYEKDSAGEIVRVSSMKELAFAKDSSAAEAVFDGLQGGKEYIISAADEYGVMLSETEQYTVASQKVKIPEKSGDGKGELVLAYTIYPDNSFYYMAAVNATLTLKGKVDAEKNATYYAKLYTSDKDSVAQFVFPMNNSTTASASVELKMTAASAEYQVAETDSKGKIVTTGEDFPYGISISPGTVQIVCAKGRTTAAVDIVNTKGKTEVQIRAADESGKDISGVRMVIKNSKGKIVSANNTTVFTSGKEAISVKGLVTGETYYLSEVEAPSGYAPAQDQKFTVADGTTTEAVLVHQNQVSTDYEVTVLEQVYAGERQLYARDTNGTYASSGAYTFYAALFADKDLLQKVSDVQQINVEALEGTTTFKNLKKNGTYYLAATNEYGEPQVSSDSCTIRYPGSEVLKLSAKKMTATIQHVYSARPNGYYYTAVLTITKNVTDSTDQPKAVTNNFYAGIYKNADFSDTLTDSTVAVLALNNSSTASVKKRFLFTSESVTYYVAEIDSNKNRLTDNSEFEYQISYDTQEVTLTGDKDQTVVITNKEKADLSKVTLYLTKKVYEGNNPKKVNETFYAGLFKDSSFKELYTKPIPMNLSDKSELTLKLTLNLGTVSNATIYIAEVDSEGNVIKDEEAFGYEIKLVNSTAAFNASRKEVQTILINSVYGTTSSGEWNNILNNNDWGDSSAVSGNGLASESTAGDIATGDDTPVGLFILLLGAAFILFAFLVLRKILKK